MAASKVLMLEACPVCLKGYDDSQVWIDCDMCKKYYHVLCVGAEVGEVGEEVDWICPDCEKMSNSSSEHSMDMLTYLQAIRKNVDSAAKGDLLLDAEITKELSMLLNSFNSLKTENTSTTRDEETANIQAKMKKPINTNIPLMPKSSQHIEQGKHVNYLQKNVISGEKFGTQGTFHRRIDSLSFDNINSSIKKNAARSNLTCNNPQNNIKGIPILNQGMNRRLNYTPNPPNNDYYANQRNYGVEQRDGFASLINAMKRQQMDELPKFFGDVEMFPIWLEQFEATTEEAAFSDLDNIIRLRNSLKGEAFRLVQGKLISSRNVDSIIYDLKNEYGRADIAVRKILSKLRSLPSPNMDNRESVIGFKIELNNSLSILQSLHAVSYLNSPMIPDEIVDKLPVGFRRKWRQHVAERLMSQTCDATLEDFVVWFTYITQWSLLEPSRIQKSNGGPNRRHNQDNKMMHHSEVGADTEHEVSKNLCRICGKNEHAVEKCKKFLEATTSARWMLARKKNLCFLCLGGRHKKECEKKKICSVNGCVSYHHKLLHYPGKFHNQNKETNVETQATILSDGKRATFYRILPIKVYGKNGFMEVNAFLDEGSGPTMITQELAKKLGISGSKESLCLAWTDNTTQEEPNSERIFLEISGVENNDKKYKLSDVRTVSAQNFELPIPDISSLLNAKQTLPHLNGIKVALPFNKMPEMLIGLEHPKLSVAHQVREGNWGEPIATRTILGWVIHGKLKSGDDIVKQRCCVAVECKPDVELHKMVANFFTTENFGVNINSLFLESEEIKRAKVILRETTRQIGHRYEVGLLWKHDNIKLPDNKSMALRRLQCFEKQLEKDKQLLNIVREKINDNIKKGYARKLTEKEAENGGLRTWYLPIFAIKNPHKPGKLRIVYDAAAKFENVCLNDCLLVGPDYLKTIVGVLWRAREGAVAVAGDIKEMYHRVLIRKEDQDSQRFLWRDGCSTRKPDTYVMNVMTFGASCSPTSAQWVKNCHAQKYINEHPRAVESIVNRHYVDDLLDSFHSKDEAIKTIREVISIYETAGMEIRNWVSNCPDIMMEFNEEAVKMDKYTFNLDTEQADKILGICWNLNNDTYVFQTNFVRVEPDIINLSKVPTKREVLKVVMSTFDPHGFAAPLIVHAKILLQKIWRKELDWDEKLTNELFSEWKKWVTSLQLLKTIKIPRCYSINLPSAQEVQLHVFVDASEEAFCAVCYFRFVMKYRIDVSFVASKNKVAPKKHLSIPRLELQAALLGVRLAKTIIKEHSIKISQCFYWSDSQTVLSWIASDHRIYKQFVANRISEILDMTNIADWFWIPSKLNVADIATKPQEKLDLSQNGAWFRGPMFLKCNQSDWCFKNAKVLNLKTEDEMRTEKFLLTKEEAGLYTCINENRFSSWWRLLRAVSWICRFKNQYKRNLTHTGESLKSLCENIDPLTTEELKEGENILLRKIQWQSFSKEIIQLRSGNSIDKSSKLWKLAAYLDENDGLLKLKGRIDATPYLSTEFKRPIILERKNYITTLLIAAVHKQFHHQLNEAVVNEIRKRFWIFELRVAIKQAVKNCQQCKIKNATNSIPLMSPLPPERLAIYENAFSHTGLDFFGPLMITNGRKQEKRYGALFTCLTTRAVHLELANSLDTSSLIMVIRNFVNRRGLPKTIYSDNGTNMHGANNELIKNMQQINWKQIEENGYTLSPGDIKTKWKFITPLAPHMGGAWERLVRTVKNVLYACMKERSPKEEILRSFLIEAENIVNSRPLTYKPLEPNSQEALTPNHFLRMDGKIVYAPGEFSSKEMYSKKCWRYSQQLANEYWKKFVLEYMPELTRRTKWYTDTKAIEIGDLVIIIDESAPRNVWERGIVEEVHPGPDKNIRSATIRTSTTIRKRPVSKLAILDVRE